MRFLLALLLAAMACGQTLDVSVVVEREGKRVDPETRDDWDGSGPYTFSRRKLGYWVGSDSARTLSAVSRMLRESGGRERGAVSVSLAPAVDVIEIPEICARLQVGGWYPIRVTATPEQTLAFERWSAEEGPLVLELVVQTPGDPLEAETGKPWHGVGLVTFRGRTLTWRLGGKVTRDPLASLNELFEDRPDARIVVDARPGTRLEEVSRAALLCDEAGFSDYVLLQEVPWMEASGALRVIDLDWRKRVFVGEQVLLESEEAPVDDEDLAEFLTHTADAMKWEEGQWARADRLLLRAHPSTPMSRVMDVMMVCGRSDVVIYKLDLALAGMESGFVPVWLPIDMPGTPESPRLPMDVSIQETGRKLHTDRGPYSGAGPFLFDDDRVVHYQFAVDGVTDVRAAADLIRKVAEVENLTLVIAPTGDVTVGDLFPLIRAAVEAGVKVAFVPE